MRSGTPPAGPEQNEGAARVFHTLHAAGHECYLVGGAVRDRLLGRSGGDLDFATNARPAEVLRLFRRSHYPNSFGTVLVLVNGTTYEVTTYRGEGRYSDHRHPDAVAFVDRIEDDLMRRDFTINAMAMDVNGRIVDPFGGEADLRRRLIRAVGDPAERLAEDPLRMMRAARLATRLCFTIEERTWQAIVEHAALLALISRERVRDELLKTLATAHPLTGIDFLDHLALLPDILPPLAAARRDNRAPQEEFDLFQHALQSLRACPRPDLRLAALLHPLIEDGGDAGALIELLKRLRLSGAEQERLTRLMMGIADVPPEIEASAVTARRLLSVHGERLPDLLRLVEAHRRGLGRSPGNINIGRLRTLARLAREAERTRQPLTLADLALTGADLMQHLGLQPGPRLGALLRRLLARVLDDPALNERTRLLELAAAEARALEGAGPDAATGTGER